MPPPPRLPGVERRFATNRCFHTPRGQVCGVGRVSRPVRDGSGEPSYISISAACSIGSQFSANARSGAFRWGSRTSCRRLRSRQLAQVVSQVPSVRCFQKMLLQPQSARVHWNTGSTPSGRFAIAAGGLLETGGASPVADLEDGLPAGERWNRLLEWPDVFQQPGVTAASKVAECRLGA